MKITKLFSLVLLLTVISSCSQVVDDENITSAETKKIENLFAPSDVRDHMTGEVVEDNDPVYFDFSAGTTVAVTDAWDIGINGTTITLNGGVNGTGNVSVKMVQNTFLDVLEAPAADQFITDEALVNAISGTDNGWYEYNSVNHLIFPLAGRIFVFKTTEGNYAKMEFLSYYKDSPVSPDPTTDLQDYFTFNYAYQDNGTTKF